MDAPDKWQSLTPDQRTGMTKLARKLVKGSILEDAATRFIAMCMAEAIGVMKDRADLRPKVKPGHLERIVWSAMMWAADNNPGFDGVPEYTDGGNSFAEGECRATVRRILAALEE